MDQPFIVKLEVGRMKHAILHAFQLQNVDLTKEIEAQINKAIGEFDFAGTVNSVVNNVLHSSINQYFTVGEGRDLIEKPLRAAININFKKKKTKK